MSNPLIGRGWRFPPTVDECGAIALTDDDCEIEQAIRIILGTLPGQRVMRPEFGCRIHELVFAPNTATTAGLAIRYISEALGRWEPRISLRRVEVEPDANEPACLVAQVEYEVNAHRNERSLVFPFYLIPAEPQASIRNKRGEEKAYEPANT